MAVLGFAERQELRRRVDQAKRMQLRREARIYLKPNQCEAATYVGQQCANDAVRGSRWCKLHRSRMEERPPPLTSREGRA